MLHHLLEAWVVQSASPPTTVDLVVPLTYGTLPGRLMAGTEAHFKEALQYARQHGCRLAYANGTNSFPGSEVREEQLKQELRQDTPAVVACSNSTVTEALAIRSALKTADVTVPREILVVTGELHARSARYIWGQVFPEARIYLQTIPKEHEIERDHPVLLQRFLWGWLLANILRHVVVRIVGVNAARWVSEPIAKNHNEERR